MHLNEHDFDAFNVQIGGRKRLVSQIGVVLEREGEFTVCEIVRRGGRVI